jgi:hypothetical protein
MVLTIYFILLVLQNMYFGIGLKAQKVLLSLDGKLQILSAKR